MNWKGFSEKLQWRNARSYQTVAWRDWGKHEERLWQVVSGLAHGIFRIRDRWARTCTLSAVSVPSDLHDHILLRCSICRHSLGQELFHVTKIDGDTFRWFYFCSWYCICLGYHFINTLLLQLVLLPVLQISAFAVGFIIISGLHYFSCLIITFPFFAHHYCLVQEMYICWVLIRFVAF